MALATEPANPTKMSDESKPFHERSGYDFFTERVLPVVTLLRANLNLTSVAGLLVPPPCSGSGLFVPRTHSHQ